MRHPHGEAGGDPTSPQRAAKGFHFPPPLNGLGKALILIIIIMYILKYDTAMLRLGYKIWLLYIILEDGLIFQDHLISLMQYMIRAMWCYFMSQG